MPVVEDEASRLVSNRTAIHIAWEGGTAPFAVGIWSGQGKKVAGREGVQDWRLRLLISPDAIPEGLARIVVEDGGGNRISKLITIVPVHSLPEQVAPGDLPPALHAVVTADQLIQTNRRHWGLEAYQNLAALADSYEPARLLRDCLETTPSCYQR
jgi:hypothetical protein